MANAASAPARATGSPGPGRATTLESPPRERMLAFIDETKERNLGVYRWKHPFLGSLSAYEWFEMVARHELRHEKQMREIAADYRKP